MHKTLLLLGLLLRKPLTGYDIQRIVRAHGALYSDLKKGNVYYLLDRLAVDGYLTVEAQPGARGPRGERLLYALTQRGRARFIELLREVLRTYDTVHTGVDVAMVFLAELTPEEALALLAERRRVVIAQRERIAAEEAAATTQGLLLRLAIDHLRMLTDAELVWVDSAIEQLHAEGWGERQTTHRKAAGTDNLRDERGQPADEE